ncbi:MAG: HlyD family efflux transporter periplasmic adaptor subunit [Planctomycetes bacterium]|nr:HlyD family efflux transporter periplasmic adaptor subunit [Planctomycetota bacterium]
MRRIFVIVTFALILLAGVLAVVSALFKPVEVEVATVDIGKAQETVYATGHVEALEQRMLRAQRAGVIAEIYASPRTKKMFREGDVVHAGDAILRLRDSALEARKSAAQAELKRVSEQLAENSPYRQAFELQIGEASDQAEDAHSREQRLKAQLDTGGISRDTYDQAKTRADVTDQQLRQLQQQYAQALEDLRAAKTRAQSEVDTLSAQEQDDLLTAPIDGVLLTLPLDVGEFATIGTEVAKVGDLRNLIIEAEVNEDDIGRVKPDSNVNIRLAGYDKATIKGQVFEILPDADRTTKGFTVKVKFVNARLTPVQGDELLSYVQVEDGARPLSGMTSELGIVVAERDGAVTFPRPALTLNNTVFVIDGSRVREVKVELGLVNFSKCEALSGLKQGEKLAVSNVKELSDGALIKPKE